MSFYTILLEVPEALDVTEVDANGDYVIGNDIVSELLSLSAEWPSSPMPDSKVISGKKLIHALIDSDAINPLLLVEVLITTYSLDWELMAMQTFGTFPQYDQNGDVVGHQADALMTFNDDALLYMNDRYEADDVTLQTPQRNWVSKYQGQSDWV